MRVDGNHRPHLVAAGVAVISLTLSACTSASDDEGEPTDGGRKAIAVNLYSRALPYFQEIAAGVEAAAEENGWEVEVTWGQTDPQLQFNQIQNAAQSQPSGMIVAPVDQEALIPAFETADSAGVTMVTVADDVAESGHDSELAFVGVEYVELGRQKAQWIVDQLGGEGTVAVVHGIRGLHFTEAQWEGAQEVFDANPGITVIDGPYAGEFSSDAGLAATENVLTANPDVDAIYFDNDDLALGGVLAAKGRGIDMDDIILIGTDGGEPARKAVAAGELDYTISLCGYATGEIATNVIIDYVESGETPDDHIVPIPVLEFTPETVEENNAKVEAKEC
jgi:ABC-type sugar transport system substrate-binding protein